MNILYLLLVGGALIARRPSIRATVRFGMAWVAVFAGVFLAVGLWRGF